MSYHFHYTQQGNSNLPVILFLHGFMGSSTDFEAVISQLSHEFCCLAIDLPGHGKTIVQGNDEQYRMPETARALVDWLEQLGIPACFLVGYSMGGRLALYLTLEFSRHFPQAVLESASPGLKTRQEQQERLQHDQSLAKRLEADFPTFLTNWYDQPLFQSLQQHPAFEQVRLQRSQNRPPELAKSLRHLSTGQQPALWDALDQHLGSLLLLVGENDRKFCQINQEMASRCPDARLEIVPQCGHAVHLEQPHFFVKSVREFLRDS
jgi:2-succinyl-6-hydroxy-2,4-cyclohexadiene-1-carboxylate synthase